MCGHPQTELRLVVLRGSREKDMKPYSAEPCVRCFISHAMVSGNLLQTVGGYSPQKLEGRQNQTHATKY